MTIWPRTSFAAFRAILCLSTAVMIGISWPLWVGSGGFPRVPWVAGIPLIAEAGWASWSRVLVTILSLAASAGGVRPRWSLACALGCLAWMVLEDQFRLQPWVYQFLVMGFAMAACPSVEARGLCRIFLIATYFYSGLSKLDASFIQETGRQFLGAAASLVGQDPAAWPSSARNAAILAMPCGEIAIAIALAMRRTRLGVWGAILQHLALVAILGPWGLAHSENVILWNASLIPQVWLLFRDDPAPEDSSPARWPAEAARLVVGAAVLLPIAEPWGLWDTWPSFGLYASANERVIVEVLRVDAETWPDPVRRVLRPPAIGDDGIWQPLDLRRWSLDERRVPLYPSSRAMIGVAEFVAARYGGPRAIRAIVLGRADRWTGKRMRSEMLGLPAIRRQFEAHWLNSRPSPSRGS